MIVEKAANIKLLILDADGVLTDGQIVINDRGEETKSFHVRDGQGLVLLMDAGVEVIIITGRKSVALEHRARELGIQKIYQGVKDKGDLCRKLMKEKKLEKDHLCCIGDDLPDLPLFQQAGLSVAVADAVDEVRHAAGIITENKGGKGAVREICEIILKARQKWEEVRAPFM